MIDDRTHEGIGVCALEKDVDKVCRTVEIIEDVINEITTACTAIKLIQSVSILPCDEHLCNHHAHAINVPSDGLLRSRKGRL